MMRKVARTSTQKVLTLSKSSSVLSCSGLQSANLMNGITMRHIHSSKEMTELQMNNKMFITKKVLDKQVDIMKNDSISDNLKPTDKFVYRHIGNSDRSTRIMLDYLKFDTMEQFIDSVVPDSIRLTKEQYFNHNGRTLDGIDSETLMLERIR